MAALLEIEGTQKRTRGSHDKDGSGISRESSARSEARPIGAIKGPSCSKADRDDQMGAAPNSQGRSRQESGTTDQRASGKDGIGAIPVSAGK